MSPTNKTLTSCCQLFPYFCHYPLRRNYSYRLYRNKLPRYFDNFLPEFGIHNHTLRNNLIRLPAIRCEFGEMNAKYQMHLRLRELASPPDTPEYPPIEISEAALGTSVRCFSNYLKTQFVRSYSNWCNINDCFVCNNSN